MASSERTLSDLHEAVAQQLLDIVKNGRKDLDKEGKEVRLSPDASFLNVARQFLKDNGIDSAAPEGSAVRDLANELPQFEEELAEELPQTTRK